MYKYFFVLLILIPKFTFASVYISEIFYDAVGSDTGREWVEIHNDTNVSVDLSSYKLNESDQNHKINVFVEGGSSFVESGKYAVVADNPSLFLEDNTSFSGLLFDSSFSLKNTGEQLILKNSGEEEIDSVFYDPSVGGAGDGTSLQKNNNIWISALATPGMGFSITDNEVIAQEVLTENSSTSNSNNIDYVKRGKIEVYAGEDKEVLAGSFVEFRGLSYGLEKEPLTNARYLWSFGDGSFDEGKNIFHTYIYPGKYKVFLEVSSLDYTNNDSLTVEVLEPKIKISDIQSILEGDGFVELENFSDTDINIGLWILKYFNQTYIIPKNTFIFNNSKIKIPFSISYLGVLDKENLGLFYPNGKIFSFYQKNKIIEEKSYPNKPSYENISYTEKNSPSTIISQSDISERNLSDDKKEKIDLENKTNQAANIYSSEIKLNLWLVGFVVFLIFILTLIFFSKKLVEYNNDTIDINDFSEK